MRESLDNSHHSSAENLPASPQRRKNWRFFAPKLQYAFVCAALVGLLKLGHSTHWSIPTSWAITAHSATSQDPAANSSPDSPLAANEPTGKEPTRVAIDQAESPAVTLSETQLRKSGVELHRVERRSVDQTLAVHGVVDYDRNHVAQLSSRVPGIVWRVDDRRTAPISGTRPG
jgi:hypothetical protein